MGDTMCDKALPENLGDQNQGPEEPELSPREERVANPRPTETAENQTQQQNDKEHDKGTGFLRVVTLSWQLASQL